MQNFLVVSYDNDEQQWFYDSVRADDAGDAEEKICKIRPYVIAANATDVKTLRKMAEHVAGIKPAVVQKQLDAIAVESGFVARCENCDALLTEAELEPVEDIGQRVAPGEILPVGQCPAEECGAVCHLLEGAKLGG